jgi:excisionase family DNA binding protein
MSEASSEVLTRNEVAALFKVHPQTVSRWVKEGVLPSWELPGGTKRFNRADMVAFMSTEAWQQQKAS